MTRIPLDPKGYRVNPDTGTIHTRYADHGNGERTRTKRGVETLLDGKEGKPCRSCYPHPRYDTPAPKPQRRRVPKAATNGAGPDASA